LIPACALSHFGGIWNVGCPTESDLARSAERQALAAENDEIQRRIDLLQAQIATRACEGEHPEILPEPRAAPADRLRDRTDLTPLPDSDRRPDGIDDTDTFPERFADGSPLPDPDTLPDGAPEADAAPDTPRDVADLDGCWSLESELEFRMRGGDGGTQPFPEWNVCFKPGSGGNGTQVMRSDDGMVCEGPIQGAFTDEGALVLNEEGDLVCNDGTEIFQRVTTCAVDDSGEAVCESVQPRTGGRGSFTLKRN
jgi:hypothetical protein